MFARAALLVALLLGTAVPVACGAAPSGPPLARSGLVVGLAANTLDGGAVREQRNVQALGVTWIREELGWQRVERTRGRFDFAAYDGMLAAAARRRIRVLPLILGSPRWLRRHPRSLPAPEAWGAFVARVVARYGPGGHFWRAHPQLDPSLAPQAFELWNEPYFAAFSRGGPDPVAFAAMQRAAVTAGRAANPRARFLLAAEGPYLRSDGEAGDWLEELYAADPALNEVFDAVAVHPYGPGDPRSLGGDEAARFRRIDRVLATLREHGAGDRRLWLTEIGWSTCRVRPECVSEERQAAYLRAMYRLVRTQYREQVDAIFCYALRDFGPAPDPYDREFGYGLLRGDQTRKPAWSIVRRAARDAR